MAAKCFPAEAPLAVQLLVLGHRLGQVMERRLARHDYNHTQAHIIMVLGRQPELMAQDLAGHVRVEPPNVTRALQALERRGLVGRQPHPTDGRASLFALTPAGREAATNIASLMREASAELEGALAPEQRATLRGAVGAMLARAESMRGG